MKHSCQLYIVCQVLMLLLIKIFNIQPPSSFISYLLFYIFLFNGFTQDGHVVLCAKKNLHHYEPLDLQNWTALKYVLKEVRGYLLLFWNNQTQYPRSTSQTIYIHEREQFRHLCLEVFHDCGCWCCYFCLFFKPLSGDQCTVSIALLLIALPQEESRNSVLIYILTEMIWYYMYTR